MPPPTRPPAVDLMRNLGLAPDPWQVEVLQSTHKQILLNCCRQAGKSTVVAMLALAEAIFVPFTTVLLLSRSLRQSSELFRVVTDFYANLRQPLKKRLNAQELQLDCRSRIVCLPCKEETIRGFSNVSLLIIDEAARVPDELYRAVRPMLATSGGRLICLSTPFGKRGFFYESWAKGGDDWLRIEIPASQIPRIKPDFLAKERRAMGESYCRQEYFCSFEAVHGLVYPDFARCVVPNPFEPGEPMGLRVGGIDFGFRNPFAAVWGVVDHDRVLWLTGEHYDRERPLDYHAARLPKDVTWHADPSGARDINELRCAGFTVRRGDNSVRPGIAAVRARLETGTLRVLAGRCPNLVAEAGLYHYSTESDDNASEAPVNENNHALDALRYLISRVDARQMARFRKGPLPDDSRPEPATDVASSPSPERPRRKWCSIHNEELWTRWF